MQKDMRMYGIRNYYQKNSAFKLNKYIYQKMRKHVMCYHLYKELAEKIKHLDDINKTENHIITKIDALTYVKEIEDALLWIPEEYRQAVLDNTTNNFSYEYTALRYNLNTKELIENINIFIYAVAEARGEYTGFVF